MASHSLTLEGRGVLSDKDAERNAIVYLLQKGAKQTVISIGVNLIHSTRALLSKEKLQALALQELTMLLDHRGVDYERENVSDLPFLLAETGDAHWIKHICCDVEEQNQLLDIDVYEAKGSVSRLDIGLPERRCFLCEEAASFCLFNQSHSAQELHEYTITTYKKLMDTYDK